MNLSINMVGLYIKMNLLINNYTMIFIYYKDICKTYLNFKQNFLTILDQIYSKISLIKKMKMT